MLPFEPESREKLEARFSLALTPTYDIERCSRGIGPFPGRQRKHVFDFENGVRMIVSTDAVDSCEHIHFSFGMSPDCKLDGDTFCAFVDGVIKEFWKPDYVAFHRELTPKAFHVCCYP